MEGGPYSKERIDERVSRGMEKFEKVAIMVMFLIIGICAGLLIAERINYSHAPNPDHLFIKNVSTGDGYYKMYFDTDREIIFSRSKGTSMYPALFYDSFDIFMQPNNTTELKIGDVIWFRPKSISGDGIMHRIITIDYDEEGWYCYTKGDNNLIRDKWKIRFDNIYGVLIAITY